MKKARLVLSAVALFALVGGALAFKAARFNGLPVWHPTTYVSTLVNGKVYATYGNFYTQEGATLFSTIPSAGVNSVTYKTTATLPSTTVLGTATDGSGFTTSITTFPVTTTLTRVTTVN